MNDNFTLYLPDNLECLKEELSNYIEEKLKEIASFFNIDSFEKIRVIIYDDKEEYQKICKSTYPLSNIAGSFGYDNVRIFININEISKERFFTCTCHEIVHLLYQNHVQEKGIQNRVVWFDEGLAANLSGEHDKELNNNNFQNYLERNIYNQDKIIPDIAFLNVHGRNYGEFVDTETNKYNGYVWSYLMIRYLIETMDKEKLQYLMRHKEEIKRLEQTIINDTYSYFSKKKALR